MSPGAERRDAAVPLRLDHDARRAVPHLADDAGGRIARRNNRFEQRIGTIRRARNKQTAPLADGPALRAYLLFLADLSDIQHRVQDGLPDVELPSADALVRSRQHRMPPLDRACFTPDAATDIVWQRLTAMADAVAMPDAARVALQRVKSAADADQAAMMNAVLSNAIPVETLAEHVFVAAALQVHFARLAARLDADALVPVGDGVCPACGGPLVSSMIVGWSGAQSARFCACSLCGTLWNYPRVRCTLCGATKGIAYQEIADGPATVKAETCEVLPRLCENPASAQRTDAGSGR